MAKMMVKAGCVLYYPDGSVRGRAGYVVATDSRGESQALAGQMDSLEPCADYISSHPVDARLYAPRVERVENPVPKKAKKKAKKKATKKAAKK